MRKTTNNGNEADTDTDYDVRRLPLGLRWEKVIRETICNIHELRRVVDFLCYVRCSRNGEESDLAEKIECELGAQCLKMWQLVGKLADSSEWSADYEVQKLDKQQQT